MHLFWWFAILGGLVWNGGLDALFLYGYGVAYQHWPALPVVVLMGTFVLLVRVTLVGSTAMGMGES